MPSFKIIANTVGYDCALIDSVPSTISGSGYSYLTIQEGARYLHYQSPSNRLELAYINKDANLNANCLAINNLDDHIVVKRYATFSGSSSVLYSGTPSDTVDYNGEGWFLDFGQTYSGQEAFSVTLSGAGGSLPEFHQIYFSESVDVDFYTSKIEIEPVNQTVKIEDQYFAVDELLEMSLDLVDSETVARLSALKLTKKPFFIYDESGLHLPDRLWYGILLAMPVVTAFDDIHRVAFTFYRLRRY